jgi:hypothetical protein
MCIVQRFGIVVSSSSTAFNCQFRQQNRFISWASSSRLVIQQRRYAARENSFQFQEFSKHIVLIHVLCTYSIAIAIEFWIRIVVSKVAFSDAKFTRNFLSVHSYAILKYDPQESRKQGVKFGAGHNFGGQGLSLLFKNNFRLFKLTFWQIELPKHSYLQAAKSPTASFRSPFPGHLKKYSNPSQKPSPHPYYTPK